MELCAYAKPTAYNHCVKSYLCRKENPYDDEAYRYCIREVYCLKDYPETYKLCLKKEECYNEH